jgi:hypothetical protein
MHGHDHIFQSISYEKDIPAEIVSGNGGSSLEELKSGLIRLTDENKKVIEH